MGSAARTCPRFGSKRKGIRDSNSEGFACDKLAAGPAKPNTDDATPMKKKAANFMKISGRGATHVRLHIFAMRKNFFAPFANSRMPKVNLKNTFDTGYHAAWARNLHRELAAAVLLLSPDDACPPRSPHFLRS